MHLPQFKIQLAVSVSNHSIFQATNSSHVPSFLSSPSFLHSSHTFLPLLERCLLVLDLSAHSSHMGSCERKGLAGSSGEEPAKVLIADREGVAAAPSTRQPGSLQCHFPSPASVSHESTSATSLVNGNCIISSLILILLSLVFRRTQDRARLHGTVSKPQVTTNTTQR